ncbi:MAG: hypothetical protein U0790_28445 [Isosphaeraceae bacterium]
MSRAEPRYRLVIFDAVEDPLIVRDMVCGATGMHPTDAVQWLARAPGVWPRDLDADTVRKLLDGLYEHRIAAEAWRSDQFPDLGAPRTFHRGACLDEGLRVEGIRGEPTHWVPWDRVEMICAGKIVSGDEFRDPRGTRWPSALVAGIRAIALKGPRSFDRRSRAQRVIRDPVGEVLILRRDPRIVFRVVENQMNYSYLGSRLKNSAVENFPIFLSDLCARAESAYLTASTRALLRHEDPAAYEFPSSQALFEYASHRLLWSWYRRDGDAQGDRPADAGDETIGDPGSS